MTEEAGIESAKKRVAAIKARSAAFDAAARCAELLGAVATMLPGCGSEDTCGDRDCTECEAITLCRTYFDAMKAAGIQRPKDV